MLENNIPLKSSGTRGLQAWDDSQKDYHPALKGVVVQNPSLSNKAYLHGNAHIPICGVCTKTFTQQINYLNKSYPTTRHSITFVLDNENLSSIVQSVDNIGIDNDPLTTQPQPSFNPSDHDTRVLMLGYRPDNKQKLIDIIGNLQKFGFKENDLTKLHSKPHLLEALDKFFTEYNHQENVNTTQKKIILSNAISVLLKGDKFISDLDQYFQEHLQKIRDSSSTNITQITSRSSHQNYVAIFSHQDYVALASCMLNLLNKSVSHQADQSLENSFWILRYLKEFFITLKFRIAIFMESREYTATTLALVKDMIQVQDQEFLDPELFVKKARNLPVYKRLTFKEQTNLTASIQHHIKAINHHIRQTNTFLEDSQKEAERQAKKNKAEYQVQEVVNMIKELLTGKALEETVEEIFANHTSVTAPSNITAPSAFLTPMKGTHPINALENYIKESNNAFSEYSPVHPILNQVKLQFNEMASTIKKLTEEVADMKEKLTITEKNFSNAVITPSAPIKDTSPPPTYDQANPLPTYHQVIASAS